MALVRMVRDPADNPEPHFADVDETMVNDYRPGNFVPINEAGFDVPEHMRQGSLDLNAPKQEAPPAPSATSGDAGTAPAPTVDPWSTPPANIG